MQSGNDPGQTARLQTIQALRGIAVLFVVISHVFHELSLMLTGRVERFNEKLFPGDFGVDLFFVISGFIMVYTCWDAFGRKGAPARFMLRRLIRIVPLYWAATTLMILVVIVLPASVKTATNDTGQWIASYLFWPYQRASDGLIRPVLGLGWSLQYEMLFYTLFALCLFLPRRVALPVLIAAIGLLLAVCAFWSRHGGEGAFVLFASHPVILEFVYGVIIAIFYFRGARFAPAVGIALFLAALLILVQMPSFNDHIEAGREFYYGIPAAMMLVAAVLSQGADEYRVRRPLLIAGEISYSTYLVHPFVVGAAALVFRRLELAEMLDPVSLMLNFSLLVVLVSLGASYLVHYGFDLPVTGWLRRRTRPAGRDAAAGSERSSL